MVKKEVHESELLFLAQRTKRDSGAEGGGESEANAAVLIKNTAYESRLCFFTYQIDESYRDICYTGYKFIKEVRVIH